METAITVGKMLRGGGLERQIVFGRNCDAAIKKTHEYLGMGCDLGCDTALPREEYSTFNISVK